MLYWDAFIQQENTTGCCIACSYKHFDSKINKPLCIVIKIAVMLLNMTGHMEHLIKSNTIFWTTSRQMEDLTEWFPLLWSTLSLWLHHFQNWHTRNIYMHLCCSATFWRLCSPVLVSDIYTVSLKKYCKHLKQNWVVMAPIFSLRHLLGEISLFLAANQTVSIVVFLELWSENCLMKVWL